MSAMASQIISLTIVYSTVYSGADQRKHQSSASLASVFGSSNWDPRRDWMLMVLEWLRYLKISENTINKFEIVGIYQSVWLCIRCQLLYIHCMGVTNSMNGILFASYLYQVIHYNDVIMGDIASQITSLTIVFSAVHLDTDQRKHQSSVSLAFVRRPVNSPHKWPVTRKMFPFDDVIMSSDIWIVSHCSVLDPETMVSAVCFTMFSQNTGIYVNTAALWNIEQIFVLV